MILFIQCYNSTIPDHMPFNIYCFMHSSIKYLLVLIYLEVYLRIHNLLLILERG